MYLGWGLDPQVRKGCCENGRCSSPFLGLPLVALEAYGALPSCSSPASVSPQQASQGCPQADRAPTWHCGVSSKQGSTGGGEPGKEHLSPSTAGRGQGGAGHRG